MAHKWKHQARYDVFKGKLRVTCACGKTSPLFADDSEFPEPSVSKEQLAKAWYDDHVGLQEKKEVRDANEY